MRDKPMRVFTRYDEEATMEETNHFLFHLSDILSERLTDTPYNVYVRVLVRGRNLLEICELDPDFSRLSCPDSFVISQIKALFSKRADIELGRDRRLEATIKFEHAERLCRETNTIFNLRRQGRISIDPCVEAVLFAAQRKISRILGEVPSLADIRARFGPGANTTITKANSCPRNKFGAVISASKELLPYATELLVQTPAWSRRGGDGSIQESAPLPVVRLDTGKVEFVAKSWKTDRAIAKEPSLNAFWQTGIGDYIARRLSLAGCDLQNGQTINRLAAKEGSLTGELATLDLSSASDTVSKELVYDLLPFQWSDFLRKFRTGDVLLNGVLVRQEKFSSMGNGFTFPLETLLFYSIASSVSERAYVFGDDIIVETGAVPLLLKVLNVCGFLVNNEKSFMSGPFRESCGGDYYSGIDIRPCFVKNRLTAAGVMVLHNFFAARYDEVISSTCRRRLHRSLQLEGPPGYGDGYLHVRGAFLRPKNRSKGWGGFSFDAFQDRPRSSVRISKGDYVLPAYSVYCSSSPDDVGGQKYGLLRRVRRPGTPHKGVLECVEAPSRSVDYERGLMAVSLPGTSGYKRISIYIWGR